ncbi:MAG: stage V sporulation protein S [Elusimicrobiota bacterium]
MNDDKNNVENEDATLLLIRGSFSDRDKLRKYIKKTAGAILAVFYKHGVVRLRCVGAASVNNAVKAFIRASGIVKMKDIDFVMTAGFKSVTFDNDKNNVKTAIVFKIFEQDK